MKAELVKRQDRWDLYGEDGSKIASSAPNPFKRLSIKNCEAIEMGYDLDELVNKFTENLNTFDVVKSDIQVGYKEGFQKALEIIGDKKFTYNDIQRAFIQGVYTKTEIHSKKEEYMQSLQQTEWDVEIEMECKGGCKYLLLNGVNSICCGDKKPKLDADGCLILKRR
jgi:hypothetical protein